MAKSEIQSADRDLRVVRETRREEPNRAEQCCQSRKMFAESQVSWCVRACETRVGPICDSALLFYE